MKYDEFTAIVSMLTTRWPFKGEEAGARKSYVERIWNAVRRHDGPEVDAFRDGVEDVVAADSFGRPSVAQVLEAGRLRRPVDPDAARDLRDQSDLRHHLTTGFLTLHSGRLRVAEAVGCRPEDVDALWESLLRHRDCPTCQFGIALIAGESRYTNAPSGCPWDVEETGKRQVRHEYKGGWTYYRCLHCGGVRKEKGRPSGVPVAFDAPDETETDAMFRESLAGKRESMGSSFHGFIKAIMGRQASYDEDEGFPDADARRARIVAAVAPHAERATRR